MAQLFGNCCHCREFLSGGGRSFAAAAKAIVASEAGAGGSFLLTTACATMSKPSVTLEGARSTL